MQHSTRKLGTTFIWLGWIIGFFFLALLFDKILDRQLNPNQSVATLQNADYSEISLQRNRQGHYLLTGEINRQAVTFLIDTGATTTSIPMHLADELGLSKGSRFRVQTANGSAYAYATLLDQLKLGEMEFEQVRASLNPGLQGEEILLGMNILKNLELVQRGERLILRQFNDN